MGDSTNGRQYKWETVQMGDSTNGRQYKWETVQINLSDVYQFLQDGNFALF